MCVCVCTPGGTEQQKLALLREATDEVGILFSERVGEFRKFAANQIRFDFRLMPPTKTHNNNSYNNFNNNNNIIITIGARAAVFFFSYYICLIYIYVFITHTHIRYGIHRDIFIKR